MAALCPYVHGYGSCGIPDVLSRTEAQVAHHVSVCPAHRLFSQAEARFFEALREAVPEFNVFGKVHLEDVITVQRSLPRSEWQAARNRIKPRHLDFVLTDPASSWIVCVIELDDSSHQSKRAQRADDFKDRALAAARVPVLRIRASSSYSVYELQRRVQEVAELPMRKDRPALSKPGPYEMQGRMNS